MKGRWLEGVVCSDDDIAELVRLVERETGREFGYMFLSTCEDTIRRGDWGKIEKRVWIGDKRGLVRFKLLWLRDGRMKKWKMFIREDLDLSRVWWAESKVKEYYFKYGIDDKFVWQEILYAFKREEFERDYLGILKELGLRLPSDDIVMVNIDGWLKVAVVETLGGERYLCTKNLCVYVKDEIAWGVRNVIGVMVGFHRRYDTHEEVEEVLIEKMMEDCFGGGDG